jgi:ankyrin repeat protein
MKARAEFSKTPWIEACSQGHVEVVRVLLNRGADPNEADEFGDTGLIWAARKGREPVARLLLERGARLNAVNLSGRTPLSHAATEQVRKTLLEHGAKKSAKSERLYRSLVDASTVGDTKGVARLLAQQISVNARDERFGRTALMWAAQNGHIEVMHLLLDRGAEIDASAQDGETALMLAAGDGRAEAVLLLLARGAQMDKKDKEGRTAADHAREHDREETLRLLITPDVSE